DEPSLPDLPKEIIEANDLLDLISHIIQSDMPPTAPEKPYVVITEQPQSKALRFRYECEGRSAGSIPGVHSTPEQKTFPSIEVRGYKGRAVVVVSCVTKDPPYRPHPHNLVGKEGCKKGVCTVEINSASMSYTFSNLGIQCVKKKDIEEALRLREEIRVDPFKTGYSHAKQPATIDLNAVRLCFQVFLEGQQRGRFTEPLQPVVSDVIYDKKAMSDLVICKLSDACASVAGGKEIILLCEKVAKEDISVRFYEEQHGHILWEDVGEFQHSNVHKQVAISFRTPRYRTLEIEQSVMVNIQLRRPSDGATSEPLPFELFPLDSAGAYYNLLNVPGEQIKIEPIGTNCSWHALIPKTLTPNTYTFPDSPTRPFNVTYQGTYRNPNESPSPLAQSPIAQHGNTTPHGPVSPYAPHSVTPSYQPNDLLYQLPQQYNFATPAPGTDPTLFQQQAGQQQQPQFQMPSNISNSQQFSLGSLLNGVLSAAGPSGMSAQGATGDVNLSSLLDMDLGKDFTMNSSEIKSLMGHLSNSEIRQELLQQQNQQQQQQNQQRMQQEEENLSNSFTRLTTNVLNDLGK
uniref:Uncharacterized protein n=1 Tax=Culex quinquefasciatus TaxID=7176 RepID=A0A1S4J7E5_CULQU